MRLDQVLHWRSNPRVLIAAAATMALTASLLGISAPSDATNGASRGGVTLNAQKRTGPLSTGATQFRMASFNVLGAGHTKPGGDRPKWASGEQRMIWAVNLIRQQDLDLIGFQEFQQPQFQKFKDLTGDQYGLYPGDSLGPAGMHNTIAWRKDTWQQVKLKWVHIPYFHGDLIRMPYVLLRNVKTGQLAWFANFHNPANARGDASKWRAKATDIEIDLVNRLRKEYPGVPVHFTGDMNDREKYFCAVQRRSELRSANGGYVQGANCVPPKPMPVDWIFGTGPTRFTGYLALRNALVKKTTDHPIVISNASIPPAASQRAGVKHVVVISVAGLRPGMVKRLVANGSRGIPVLVKRGASTMNARTGYSRTTQLPEAVSMITGRSVNAEFGGHGVTAARDTGRTIHQSAGGYVTSVFDMVHNYGFSTALYAQDPDMAAIKRSYNATNGALDRYNKDNGRNKFSTYKSNDDSSHLVHALRRQLGRSPKTFSFLQINDLDVAGHKSGFSSVNYRRTANRVDELIRRLRVTIKKSGRLKKSTLIVVTAEHAGHKRTHSDPSQWRNYRVPFIVWGPTVPAGGDLYAMNANLSQPRKARPGYNQAQPVRNVDVANLTMTALGLPSIPGSNINKGQTLSVFNQP